MHAWTARDTGSYVLPILLKPLPTEQNRTEQKRKRLCNVALPHKQLHGAFSRTEQGRVPIPHTLHGTRTQDAAHHEEHADCTNGTSAGPWEPLCAGPAQ